MIPSYILFALLSMVLIGIYDFVYSKAVRKGVSAGTMTCSQACFFVPIVTLWSYLEGTYIWSPLLFLGPIWAFMRSVSLGEASVSTPIYRISFVITALVAILFLGEQMTIRKGIGFLLAAASIFFLSEFRFGSKAIPRDRTTSILWALAAMTSVGLLNIIYKLGVSGGVAPAMFLHSQGMCFITVAFIYARLTQGGPRFSRQGWAHGFVASLSLSMGLIALLAALKIGEASVVTPIGQLSFVVSALMVTLWMGERFTKRKVAGLLLAVGTIVAFLPG
ncbi:MAG: DMT family transporter [Deltaproteobacteria bacterium]|nr:DMT family transporter [Deltaproteobacteria bacterium]